MNIGTIVILVSFIGCLLVYGWLCSSIPTIAKEILLYPVLVFSITFFGLSIFWPPFWGPHYELYFVGTLLIGIGIHYLTMKKIDNTTSKIDIYIYTLFQVLIFITIGRVEKYNIVYYSSYIIFYLINIYCFYRFRRDKLLKIIIMPSLMSVLILFAFGLVMMILSMISG